jgi:hypothetical protein
MASKKSFYDPITQFISSATPEPEPQEQEQTPAADAGATTKKTARKRTEGGSVKKRIQSQLDNGERKTKKAQVLFKPSTYDGLKRAAADMNTSVNNLINVLAEDFLKSR